MHAYNHCGASIRRCGYNNQIDKLSKSKRLVRKKSKVSPVKQSKIIPNVKYFIGKDLRLKEGS